MALSRFVRARDKRCVTCGRPRTYFRSKREPTVPELLAWSREAVAWEFPAHV